MTCPYCGGQMRHGEIASTNPGFHNHLQWIEGEPLSKKRKFFGFHKAGKLMKMPYVGINFWIPADFCPKCKKMIFETDIIEA